MPTTLVGQNLATILEEPTISVRNCPVEIVKHKTSGSTATLNVQLPAAGSVSGGGTNLKFTKRSVGAGGRTNVKVSLTSRRQGSAAQIPPAADQGARRVRAEEQERATSPPRRSPR